MMDRGNLLSLNVFHKIHCHENRPIIRICMPKLDIEQKVTHSKGGYIPFKYLNDKFNSSFFPNSLKMWNNLPKDIQYKDVSEFKICIKNEMKPRRYKHFASGPKTGNALLTRIRVGRSFLNQHKFTIGLADSPECQCHFKTESPEHYFLQCFLYSPERRILLDLIEHNIPKFTNLNKKQKLDIILRGLDIDNPDFTQLNKTLTKYVQNFILSTKRFSD